MPVNRMWQFLFAGNRGHLRLLPEADDGLWQLRAANKVTTGILWPAHVDIWTQGGTVCRRFVCELVTSVSHCESSLRSRHNQTCATSERVELRRLEQIEMDEDERQGHGRGLRGCYYSNRCGCPLERVPVSWHFRQIMTVESSKADGSARSSLLRRVWCVAQTSD